MHSALRHAYGRGPLLAGVVLLVATRFAAAQNPNENDPPTSAPSSRPGAPPTVAPYGPFAGQPLCPVRRISSAEQILVYIDGKSKIVTLVGIQISGPEADRETVKAYLDRMLTGEAVIVRPLELPKGRESTTVPAHVYRAPDGLFINEELIRQGLVRVDDKYDGEFLERFLEYEKRAKELKRGIWENNHAEKIKAGGGNPAKATPSPSGGAAEKKPAEPAGSDTVVYVTEKGSKYHRQSCQWAKTGHPMSLDEAKQKFEPCKVCKPPE